MDDNITPQNPLKKANPDPQDSQDDLQSKTTSGSDPDTQSDQSGESEEDTHAEIAKVLAKMNAEAKAKAEAREQEKLRLHEQADEQTEKAKTDILQKINQIEVEDFPVSPTDLPVAGPKTVEVELTGQANTPIQMGGQVGDSGAVSDLPLWMRSVDDSSHTSGVFAQTVKKTGGLFLAIVPYLVVFAIGVGGYYFFIADDTQKWNLPIFKRQEKTEAQKAEEARQKALATVKEEKKEDYEKWIKQFFFTVSDANRLAMDTVSPNGFTNFENYLLGLNPKTRDANQNGQVDALDVFAGINPETERQLTSGQKDVLAKYLKAEEVRKRTVPQSQIRKINPKGVRIRGVGSPVALQGATGQVAGIVSSVPLTSSQASPVLNSPPSTSSPTAGNPAKVNNHLTALGSALDFENKYNINLSIPGRLEVPSIGVNVPIIWTADEKDFDADLKKGVVHHPKTPLPGDLGTSYISGHSSSYLWRGADYNKIFSRMGELPVGATFKVTVVNTQGLDVLLYYEVVEKQIFKIGDQAQFANFADSRVALSTCWPIGQLKDRMVAFGKLVKVEDE